MAIDAKIAFLQQTEKQIADIVTVSEMSRIMETLNDTLQHFEMRSISTLYDEADDMLQCYLSALSVECRSPKTLERYEYVIKKLMAFVKVPTRQITVYHLRSYLQHEKSRGICDNTLEGLRQVFSAYFNWLQRESLIDKNPAANLGSVKVAKKEKKTYSETDIEKLVRGCNCVRDRAIVYFLASTGCRISEMTGLDRDSVKPDELECIVHGKGNKERTVYLSQVAGMVLSEYLATRTDDNPALFVGQRHERLLPDGVRKMLKTLGENTGVDHVHPHKFRRTLATNLARRGMQIQTIASILGHERLDTCMAYVVINSDDKRSNYRRFA